MQSDARSIRISVSAQRLDLCAGEQIVRSYPVSTSRFGLGTEEGSFKTPTGEFRIAEAIGDGAPAGTLFRSRVPVTPSEPPPVPDDDQVLSRILWLEGAEPQNANTRARYIYIHGTNREEEVGTPASHGCIRMRNEDVIDLFAQIAPGMAVSVRA